MSLIAAVVLLASGCVVDGKVPSGNIVVEKIDGDMVSLSRELRDTATDWFYWAFRAKGTLETALSDLKGGANKFDFDCADRDDSEVRLDLVKRYFK